MCVFLIQLFDWKIDPFDLYFPFYLNTFISKYYDEFVKL